MLQQRSDGDSFDVVVVGARCAGSPLATLLARRGLRVCVVDRADFPSDTPSTHVIQPSATKLLGELGVLDRLLELTPALDEGLLRLEGTRMRVEGIERMLGAPLLNVRRVTLDSILLEAAAAAGAEVRTRTAVTGLVESAGRVTGVETTAGRLRAPLVVGADGARSTVARLLAVPEYHRTAGRRIFLWAYLEGVAEPRPRLWFGAIDGDGFLACPTDSGRFLACFVAPVERWPELRGDRAGGFEEGMRRWPELEAVLAPGRRAGPVRMMSRWHGFFRQGAGPGWALCGDAGHFKDPTPGQGIADALRQAATLAPAIERALDGEGDAATRAWWHRRDREAWRMYWFARELGDPLKTPLVHAAIPSVFAADPALGERLVRVFARDLSPADLLPPAATAALFANAWRQSPGSRAALAREVGTILGTQLRRWALLRSGARRPREAPVPAGATG